MSATEDLMRRIDEQHLEIKKYQENTSKLEQKNTDTEARLMEIEQTLAARRSGGPMLAKTLGATVIEADGYKNFLAQGMRGTSRIQIKSLTSAPGSVGSMIAPDQQATIVGMPKTRLTVRSLLASGSTQSNLVKFIKQTGRTNNASVVTEGAQKPESDIVFTPTDAPVRTIATWIPVTRQAMEDAGQLQSIVDTELRYMIDYTEEQEILFGDGTGDHLEGIVPQATPFNAPFVVAMQTNLDIILAAIAQAQQSKIMATGVIINDLDWKRMQALKDSTGRYIGGGPFGTIGNNVWTLPVVDTPAIPEGEFLVGAFAIAAQIIDRMQTEVLVSSEDRDNFIKNMLTVRAENRVALAVKMPEALVFGDFATAT